MPSALRPLIMAAEAGEPLEPALTLIVRNFGFETSPPKECQAYVFTTLPVEWVIRYDQMAYIEIDPRILKDLGECTSLGVGSAKREGHRRAYRRLPKGMQHCMELEAELHSLGTMLGISG